MTETNQKTSKEEGEGVVAFGVVTEALPNTLFRVQLTGEEKTILAYLAGKMRLHRIRVLVGDKVEVLLDSYGGKGRIIRRSLNSEDSLSFFMKIRSTIKKRCPQCKMVKRAGHLYIICANKPRHKQKQA